MASAASGVLDHVEADNDDDDDDDGDGDEDEDDDDDDGDEDDEGDEDDDDDDDINNDMKVPYFRSSILSGSAVSIAIASSTDGPIAVYGILLRS